MEDNQINYIFCASAARSGSTLLAFLLNTHPEIASIAEMEGLIPSVDPTTFQCSCGELIKDCPFWQGVTRAMQMQGYDFSYDKFDMSIAWQTGPLLWKLQKGFIPSQLLDRLRYRLLPLIPGYTHHIQQQVDRNIALSKAILSLTGKRFNFDTSKDVSRIQSLARYSDVDLFVIHLIRDVRGFVASHYRREPERSIEEHAREWVKVNRKTDFQLKDLPEDTYMRVHYEDFCRNTVETLNEIYSFLDLDANLETPPHFRSAPHHIIGAQMRLKDSTEIVLDERWKNELTPAEINTIQNISAELMENYGYEMV